MSKRHGKSFWEEIKDSAKKPLQTWKKEPKQSDRRVSASGKEQQVPTRNRLATTVCTGKKAFLPRSYLPPLVPNFTGRQSECEEIIGHVTSESTRIVSIWGSPGFGKTSVAIAVGHGVQSRGVPVCWLSLRGFHSKADLISKLLSLVTSHARNDQPSVQRLSPDDELCLLLAKISDQFVLILDNADDLLESGLPRVKEEVIELLEEILRQNENVTFLVTTRQSFEFVNLHFDGHQSVRIRPLDEASSQTLVQELLSNTSTSDVTQITRICGNVPLAMKLLCSFISEDGALPSQVLDEFMASSAESLIIEMLDNPDYPTSHRLKFLFESSFQRLSVNEKEALVSLCILPENFNMEIAAAVLGKTGIIAKKILHSLRRKSIIDSSLNPGSFTMHKLLQSFAREKGEHEMKETVLNSKARFYTFYVSLFEKLNERFLSGHSMSAFISFYENKQSIVESLIEGCSFSRTADCIFDVLVKAEMFLDSVFWISGGTDKIYHSALKAASLQWKGRLLTSRAFIELTWGAEGIAMQFLLKVNEIQASSTPAPCEERGKYLCYLGIYEFVVGKMEHGVQCLQEALPLMSNSPEQSILKLISFQILALYYQFQNNSLTSSEFYSKALQASRECGDEQLLVISKEITATIGTDKTNALDNQPLLLQVIYHVDKASQHFFGVNNKNCLRNILLKTLKKVETTLPNSQLGLFPFHRVVVSMLKHFSKNEDAAMFAKERITNHQTALEHCKTRFGEEHAITADSYESLGVIQHSQGDFTSALYSSQRALDIRRKLFGEEHASTADSYESLGFTQHSQGDFTSALYSSQRALDIRRKLFGEEHAVIADSYKSLGVTQHSQGDLTSALQSLQRALDIRRKLFGEEHASTANSYESLGVTKHSQGDFSSALQSKRLALDIRLKLFGEEHPSTADSYESLGVTQHSQGDFTSALCSSQAALDIRRKLFGEEHASTADSYKSLGVTQHSKGDFTSALKSKQYALDVRRKLFGEEHASTAQSYESVGVTKHSQGDFTSALKSKRRALDIRLKLFGEEHASTADSYRSIGVTQHLQGDFTAALHSDQCALDIRRKLFGEDHASTADSYESLGFTQHSKGDFISALKSKQRALDIRRKLFGEEHSDTADSYESLGITQHSLGDFTSALQSKQRALDIRHKLLGEGHASIADSYFSLGDTQHSLGDFTSALQSTQHALDIRAKCYEKDMQAQLAFQSDQCKLDIQRNLLEFKNAQEREK